jgi:hypothetical protein
MTDGNMYENGEHDFLIQYSGTGRLSGGIDSPHFRP